jgi:glycosyltransferase involved in cell wall biosynthesis
VAPPLLNDDLLRHLIAAGQVDIVIGLPTLNNAETIADVVRTASHGLTSYFPRARTVIISADGGSRDGTPEIVEQLSSRAADAFDTRGVLRTQHHISASYGGVPGKAGAIRLIFAVAELLQARAVAVLDPEVTSGTPAWIEALVGAVL